MRGSPLNISLRVTGLNQATSQLQQFAQGGQQSFAQLQTAANQAAASATSSTRSLTAAANAVSNYAAGLNPAIAQTIQLGQAMTQVRQLANAGLIPPALVNQLTTGFAQMYAQIQRGAQGASVSVGQSRFAVQQLGFQLNDVAQGLLTGQSPFTILMQQGFQVAQAFQTGGGVRAVLAGFGASVAGLISPTTVLVAGLVALGGAVVALTARAISADSAMRQFSVTLEAMNATAKASPAGLEAVAHTFTDIGVSASEARTQINQLITAGIDPQRSQALIRAAANFQAVFGGKQFDEIKNAFAGGIESATNYGLKVRALTVDQAAFVRQLILAGEAGKAWDFIQQQITAHSDGLLRRSLGPLGQVIKDLNTAYQNFMDTLSKSDAIRGVVDQTTALVKAIDDLFKKEPPEWFKKLFLEGMPGLGDLVTLLHRMMGVPVTGSGPGGISGPPGAPTGTPLNVILTGAGARYGGLEPDFQIALRDMFAKASEDGITLGIGSGFRTFQRQTELYNEAIRKYGRADLPGHQVAVPGTSYHERGLAADLTGAGGRTITAGSAEDIWLRNNAAMFGLWRPVRGEAWHVQMGGPAAATTGLGLLQAGVGQDPLKIDELNRLLEAENRRAAALKGMGLVLTENEARERAATIALENGLSAQQKAVVEGALLTNVRKQLNNELSNSNTLLNQEISGQQSIVAAYQSSSREGKIRELQFKAEVEALRTFGTTDSAVAKQFIENRTKQNVELEKASEQLKSAQEIIANRDSIEVLKLQGQLLGQTSEEIQRQVTILQEKQKIEREFPLLSEQERAAKLKVSTELANQTKILAEQQRQLQRVEDFYRQIGSTIESSIGSVIDSIFDPSKPMDWGKTVRDMAKSLFTGIAQNLFIKPLTGDLLGFLGAPPAVTQQYGSTGLFSGSTGSILSLGGNLFGSEIKSFLGLDKIFSGSGGGGLFSGLGSSLGFATTAPVSSVFGIEASTLSSLGLTGNMAVPGSVFGMTSLGSALGGIGMGFAGGNILNSLLGGNRTGGMIGSGLGSLAGFGIGTLLGGPILGALLGGLGGGALGGLFGNNRPRNQSAGFNLDLGSFALTAGFAGGNQQIDQDVQKVGQSLQSFLAVLKQTGGSLSGTALIQSGVNTGFTVDSTLPMFTGRYNLGKDPTAALQTIELALVRSMTGISDTMRKVIDQVSDPAALEGAIAFANAYDAIDEAAKDAFASVEKTTQTMGPFSEAMTQIDSLFQGLTDQANQFGLSLDPINAALEEATRRLQTDYGTAIDRALNEASGQGFLNTIQDTLDNYIAEIAQSQAIGLGTDTETQYLLGQVFKAQINSILDQLDSEQLDLVVEQFTGLNDVIVELAVAAESTTAEVEQLQQRLSTALENIQRYVDQLTATPGPAASPETALLNAQSQFAYQYGLASQGNIGAIESITSYADQLVQAVSGYYGSSQAGQDIISQMIAQLNQLAPTSVQDPTVVLLQDISDQTTTLTTTVGDGTVQTTQVIASTTQSLIDSNNAAAQKAIDQNNADLMTLVGVTNDTAAANIAINQQTTADLIAGAEANTTAILEANDVATAALIDQNTADATALIDANNQAAALALDNANLKTQEILDQNDINSAALISSTAAKSDALLAQAQSAEVSTTSYIEAYGTAIFTQIATWGSAQISAIYDAAGSIVRQIENYAGTQIGQDAVIANNSINSNTGLVNSVLQAINTGVAGIISTIQNWVGTQMNNDTALANSLINVGATFSNAQVSAIYGAANSIITTEATYANNQLANQDNWLSAINSWLGSIWNVESNYGQAAYNQRNEMIQLLFDIREQLRLTAQVPAG